MKTTVILFLIVIAVIILIAVLWRFASRRQSIPCPVWLRWLVELDNPFTSTNRAAVIVEHLALQSGMMVLDVGCGPGRVTLPIARKIGSSGKVVAVDIQSGMLARARERARDAGLSNIEFRQVAAGDGELGFNLFDCAVLVTVLGEIPDRKAALKDIYHALKPGAILSVTEIIYDPHFQSRATVTRLANEVGFREKQFFGNRLAYTLHLQKPDS